MLSNQNRCGRDKRQGFIFYVPNISKNDRLFVVSQRLKSMANNRIDANVMIKQYKFSDTYTSFLKLLGQTLL